MKKIIIGFFILCLLFTSTIQVYCSDTTLSLEPTAIELPLIEQEPLAVYFELTIHNVTGLKSYSFEFNYNRTVLEFINAKMYESFIVVVGGWTGNGFYGTLGKSFTGSATMFVYAFKILTTGSTQIEVVNAELRTDGGLLISHNVSGCTIEVKPFQEWIDGEYAELKTEHDSLITTYTQYTVSYSHSNDEYNSLLSEKQMLTSNLGTSQTLNYVLITTSVILIAATTYFATHRKAS